MCWRFDVVSRECEIHATRQRGCKRHDPVGCVECGWSGANVYTQELQDGVKRVVSYVWLSKDAGVHGINIYPAPHRSPCVYCDRHRCLCHRLQFFLMLLLPKCNLCDTRTCTHGHAFSAYGRTRWQYDARIAMKRAHACTDKSTQYFCCGCMRGSKILSSRERNVEEMWIAVAYLCNFLKQFDTHVQIRNDTLHVFS